MAKLMISFRTPITLPIIFGNENNIMEQDYFNLLKKQTVCNYEKIISTKINEDLDFYLPQTFNHILAAVTSMNQFLLSVNFCLQKNSSEINEDAIYKKNILHTIFAHHNLSGQDQFDNKLGTQFNYLFKLLESYGVSDLKELRHIGIIFTIVENFFRNHEAHGLSGSLIDFFKGYNIGICPSFILKEEYLENFDLFNELSDRFYFTFPEDDFLRFKGNIERLINEVKDYEIKSNTLMLSKKMAENVIETFTFSTDKIGNINKKKLNPRSKFIIQELEQNILFVRSDIVRTYFKYNSIVWNNDIIAHNIAEIDKALELRFYKLINECELTYYENISITPTSLLKYFKTFVEHISSIVSKYQI